ncbi:MAG: TonB-dependent receptor [Opitutus sp.]|nr:TonB-dependent receptor [Opitutus sp.]
MHRARLFLLFLTTSASLAAIEQLAPFAVTADRAGAASSLQPVLLRTFASAELTAAPTLDDALRADPAFSLFRRSSSLAANPTAQGVSLRGIGPSGASRSLVLLDGVPLNDPFGGWVAWSQVPVLALSGAEVRHGGGSTAWGNAALGGTVALYGVPPTRAQREIRWQAGELGTRRADLALSTSSGPLALRVDARAFATDGFMALLPHERGGVDRPLATDNQVVQLQAQRSLGAVDATLTLRQFAEDRENGTTLQRNASRASFGALTLRGATTSGEWAATLYRQNQTFRSFFSAVSADRTTENPANDQFDVPADAFGGSATFSRRESARQITAGVDYRQVRGETREDFLFSGGAFTRRRFAGGTQRFAGAFVGLEETVRETLTAALQVRADAWANTDGHRREVDRRTGAGMRDEIFPAQRDLAWNTTAGLNWRPTQDWTLRAAAYTAFRVPTLNELYRPFRVGNTNTEANPALSPETLRGLEGGVEHHRGPLSVSLTGFVNELRDAVANVTLATTPTLVSRQRLNLARIRVRGVEGRARWAPATNWRGELSFLFSDARVTAAPVQPELVGRRLAQVPRLTATAGFSGEPWPEFRLSVRGRWSSRQFEDDENQLPLGAAGTIDATVEKIISRSISLALSADNLLDRRIAVSRSANAPTAYGAPRTVRASLRVVW